MEARLSQRSANQSGRSMFSGTSSQRMKGSMSLPSLVTPKNMSPDEKCKWLKARLQDVERESRMLEDTLSAMDQASDRSRRTEGATDRSAFSNSNRSAYSNSNRSALSNSNRSAYSNSNRSALSSVRSGRQDETHAMKIVRVLQTMEEYMRKHQIRCIDLFRQRNFNSSYGAGDDKLDRDEFKNALLQMGMDMSASEVQLIVNHLDGNGDGEIDLAELDAVMRQARRDNSPQDAMNMIAKIAQLNPHTELMMISHREAKRRVAKSIKKKKKTNVSASLLASCKADDDAVRAAVQKMEDVLKSKGLRIADLFTMALKTDTANAAAGGGVMGGNSFQEQHEMMLKRKEKGYGYTIYYSCA